MFYWSQNFQFQELSRRLQILLGIVAYILPPSVLYTVITCKLLIQKLDSHWNQMNPHWNQLYENFILVGRKFFMFQDQHWVSMIASYNWINKWETQFHSLQSKRLLTSDLTFSIWITDEMCLFYFVLKRSYQFQR